MRTSLFSILLILVCLSVQAQPAILPATSVSSALSPPNPSAMLDVSAADKGILIPRMTFANRTSIPVPAPDGLLVYQTDVDAPSNSAPGFYYFDGTSSAWKPVTPPNTSTVNPWQDFAILADDADPGSPPTVNSVSGRYPIPTVNTWNARQLWHILSKKGNSISRLFGNGVVGVVPGKYYIRASAPAYFGTQTSAAIGSGTKVGIRKLNGSPLLIGNAAFVSNSDRFVQVRSTVEGVIEITQADLDPTSHLGLIELIQLFTQVPLGPMQPFGEQLVEVWGKPANISGVPEVYSQMFIQRIQ